MIVARRETELTADCVEWCPAAGFEDRFVCATYQLEEATATRRGQLRLHAASGDSLTDLAVREVATGVLDCKWAPAPLALGGGAPVLGVASAGPELELFALAADGDGDALEPLASAPVAEGEDFLSLSLDWSSRVDGSVEPQIAVSQGDGRVAVYDAAPEAVRLRQTWAAHDLQSVPIEVWICAFDCHHPSTVFSGGDDARLKGWDLRAPPVAPTFVSRAHEAGVCSAQFHAGREHVVATGSYDESALLWDARSMRQPLSRCATGGGVWRLKWHPSRPELLLSASMHGGFRVLRVGADDALEVLLEYNAHQELAPEGMEKPVLAYGVDWSREDGERPLIGACSFYDRLLTVWRPEEGLW